MRTELGTNDYARRTRAPTSYQQQSEFYLTFMRIRTGRNTYEPKERRADAFLFALNLRNRKPPGPYIPKTVKKTIPERSQKNQEHYRTSDAHSLASIARNLCLISTPVRGKTVEKRYRLPRTHPNSHRSAVITDHLHDYVLITRILISREILPI
jgi:hypothetical protein